MTLRNKMSIRTDIRQSTYHHIQSRSLYMRKGTHLNTQIRSPIDIRHSPTGKKSRMLMCSYYYIRFLQMCQPFRRYIRSTGTYTSDCKGLYMRRGRRMPSWSSLRWTDRLHTV